MRTASTSRDPWDDGRLAAAFAARAAADPTPIDLTGRVLAAVRADRREVAVGWRRLSPGMATAAILVVAAIAGLTLIGSLRSVGPAASPDPASPSPTGIEAVFEVAGLPVLTVSDAIAIREFGEDDREIAVRGWFSPIASMSCPYTSATSPVQPVCPDQFVVLMAEPESLVTVREDGFSGREPIGPAIQIDLDGLETAWRPGMPASGPAVPIEIAVVGHFDDRRSTFCPAAEEQACRDRFVVDRVAWVDGVARPRSVMVEVSGATSSTADEIAAVAERQSPEGEVLSLLAIDGPEGLARLEPVVATSDLGLTDQAVVWGVRVLEGGRATTYLIPDGTEDVYQVDPTRVIRIAPGPTLPAAESILGIPVISVPEMIARRDAGLSPEEIAVRGWALRSSVIYDCAIHLDPHHPLVPFCQSPIFLMEQHESSAGASTVGQSVELLVGPDAYVDVVIPYTDPIDVIAIGHFLDHRWPTCPALDQAACQGRFVVDRLVGAGGSVDDPYGPWTIGEVTTGSDLVTTVARLEARVGEVAVISAGNLRGSDLALIEPHATEIGRTVGEAPMRLLRALLATDPETPRTFLVSEPASGRETVWELTEDGPEELPPADPGEATASPIPPSTPSPDGRIRVELWAASTPDGEPLRVTIIDRSGLVTSAREVRLDDPPWSAAVTGDAGVMVDGAGRLRLLWIGTVCDGATVVTIGAGLETIEIDGGTRPPCDAMAIGHELVLETSEPVDPAVIRVSVEVIVAPRE